MVDAAGSRWKRPTAATAVFMAVLVAALVTVLVAGVAVVARPAPAAGQASLPEASAVRVAAARQGADIPHPPAAVAARATGPSVVAAPAPPPGLTADQWQALQAEMATRPDGAAELQRLAAYFGWSDAWKRWREGRAGGASPSELRSLAQAVEAGLPDRLAAHEVSSGEALQIMSSLLVAEPLAPDERERRLLAWQASRPGGAFGPVARDGRALEFARAEADLVAQWRARGGADAGELDRRLQALREAHFTAPAGERR